MNIERDYFWFQLFDAPRIGPKYLISVAKILEKEDCPPELSKILGKIRAEDEEKVSAEYGELKEKGIDIIYPGHLDFPPHLLEIAPMLFIKGKRKLLTSDGAAIVGSRNVSDTGIRVAWKLAAEFASAGLNVVSGYAKGVDSEAHLGALAAEGTTTMVLPYGIKKLRQKSAFRKFDWQRDVLAVSQFDPDVKWLARNAMVRNKLVCALSKVVVVIESGLERDAQGKMSGTFNTAQTALSMNLPLFVLNPECFDNPPKGNADLIDRGGKHFDPDDGAEGIISAAKTESSSDEQQDSPEQLKLF